MEEIGLKKICFISLNNMYLNPYIKKYQDIINCDYDIIYWNRHNLKEEIIANNIYEFKYTLDEGSSTMNKLRGYLNFAKFAKRIIKEYKYSGIILLQTSCGILLRRELIKYYNKKYIVDIRDYTMEKNKIFYFLESSLIINSGMAIISSEGYKKFLPAFNYIKVHNDINIDEDIVYRFRNRKKEKGRIVISFIGLIRFNEENKRNIKIFANDDRFELRFIGENALSLSEYCNENNIFNVKLIDRFPPSKTLDYYEGTDIIYNLYGNNTPLLDYALSNKLYYAAKLGKPILVSPNTYMEKISVENGFGFSLNPKEPDILNNLYDYYINIEWESFFKRCDLFIQSVELDNRIFNKEVIKFIGEI